MEEGETVFLNSDEDFDVFAKGGNTPRFGGPLYINSDRSIDNKPDLTALEKAGAGIWGTSVEIAVAGTLAGYINIPLELKKSFGSGTLGDFFALHGISSIGAAAVFSTISMLMKYTIKYQKHIRDNLHNSHIKSFSEFAWKHKAEIAASFAGLWGFGTISFFMFTGFQDFGNNQHWSGPKTDIISFIMGMLPLIGGNIYLSWCSKKGYDIQLPWEKLLPIATALLGFIAGIHLTGALAPLCGATMTKWVLEPFVAPMLGAGGALIGNGVLAGKEAIYGAGSYLYGKLPTLPDFAWMRNAGGSRASQYETINDSADDVQEILNKSNTIDIDNGGDGSDKSCFDCFPASKEDPYQKFYSRK